MPGLAGPYAEGMQPVVEEALLRPAPAPAAEAFAHPAIAPAAAPLAAGKPRFRGSSHQGACFVALGAGALLVLLAPTAQAAWAAAAFAIGQVLLFGVSAVYHRIDWPPLQRMWMRRLDHATIFLFTATAYVPFCLLAMPPGPGRSLLTWACVGAALGVGKSLLWPSAPKPLTVSLYVALGALAVTHWGPLSASLQPLDLVLVLLGGALYCLGALAYATKWPNPFPRHFGHHEVFHAFTIAAGLAHFVAIAHVVMAAKP